MNSIPKLYTHQINDTKFTLERPRVLNFGDCGTGKTAVAIQAIKARKHEGRTLVVCPKSIMQPAWGKDLKTFAPNLRVSYAYAENRKQAFEEDSDVVIINHDGVKWITEQLKAKNRILKGFCQLIVDESTAYKNHSQRTTAAMAIRIFFKYRIIMTGTPRTETMCDVWRQVFIADDGERLGKSFYKFRNETCTPVTLGNGVVIWQDRDGMEEEIYDKLKDITIRNKLEDCIDIPPREIKTIETKLNAKHRKLYDQLMHEAILAMQTGTVVALNRAVLRTKLLQLTSGAIYHSEGEYEVLDQDRYELIAELAQQRPQAIVAFMWRHQKDSLLKLLPKAGVIDGSAKMEDRNRMVQEFQDGTRRILLIHPKAGAHGLTLTAGYDTIWASPTDSSEAFIQFNHRLYRNGQTKPTRVLLTAAENTIEADVYEHLQGKLTKAYSLLELFKKDKSHANSN